MATLYAPVVFTNALTLTIETPYLISGTSATSSIYDYNVANDYNTTCSYYNTYYNNIVYPKLINITTNNIVYPKLISNITTSATNVVMCVTDCKWPVYGHSVTPIDRIKQALKDRCIPNFINRNKSVEFTKDIREQRARETLRKIIGDKNYKNFLKSGFISIKAKSGRIYQIYPGHNFTKVYENGKLIEKLCVVLQGSFPPTDSLIVRYLMILNNETQFWNTAIKHGGQKDNTQRKTIDMRPLPEILKEFKLTA